MSEVRVLPNHPSHGWPWLIIHDLLKSVVTWGCPSVTSPQIINNLATLWLWLPFILGPGWGHLRTWFAKPQGILMTPSSSPKLWSTAWTKKKCRCSKSVLIWPVLLNLCSSEYRYRNHQKTWKKILNTKRSRGLGAIGRLFDSWYYQRALQALAACLRNWSGINDFFQSLNDATAIACSGPQSEVHEAYMTWASWQGR